MDRDEGAQMGEIAGLEVGLPAGIEEVDAGWLTRVLRTSGAIDADTSVATAENEPFMEGVGLLSVLFRSNLTYTGPEPGPSTVIVKFPTEVEHMRAMADASNVYEREVRFYTELLGESALRSVTVHASMVNDDKSNFVIVMEDVSHLRQADRMNGVTWDEAVAAIKSLGRFPCGMAWFSAAGGLR